MKPLPWPPLCHQWSCTRGKGRPATCFRWYRVTPGSKCLRGWARWVSTPRERGGNPHRVCVRPPTIHHVHMTTDSRVAGPWWLAKVTFAVKGQEWLSTCVFQPPPSQLTGEVHLQASNRNWIFHFFFLYRNAGFWWVLLFAILTLQLIKKTPKQVEMWDNNKNKRKANTFIATI